MIEVIKYNHILDAFIDYQNQIVDCQYKISKYNYLVQTSEQKYLVYNTLHNAFAVIDEDTWHLLCTSTFDKVTKKDLDLLVKHGILVPESLNEYKDYLELFEFLQRLSRLKTGIFRYNIYTTTYCNARCPYCFEKGILQENMDASIADKVVAFIESTYSKTSDEIYFRWFGGEPLINANIITYISKQIKEKKIPFFSTISTNGLLFNDELISIAKSIWNLNKVRFSFDGMEEVHNRRKNYVVSNGNPFKITLNNLDSAVKAGLRVVVRLTLDTTNAYSLFDLANLLISRYGGNNNITIYSKCIFSEVSKEKFKFNPKSVEETLKLNANLTNFLLESEMYDYERLAPIGLRTYYCAANDPHKVVISPRGNLCSCECNCVKTEYWGDVVDKISNRSCYDKWHIVPKVDFKCQTCPLLPVCTPFQSICPSDYFSCHDRFETTMRLFMLENYKRYKNGKPLLKDSENFYEFSLS